MTKDQVIQINLMTDAREPIKLPGVFLTISFFLNGKYRYAFRSPPSDPEGCVLISYDYLEENRLEDLRIQPWDFKTTLDECDASVKISLPSNDELILAADVLDTMGLGEFPDISDSWRKAQNRFLSAEDCEISLGEGLNKCELICCVETPYPRGAD